MADTPAAKRAQRSPHRLTRSTKRPFIFPIHATLDRLSTLVEEARVSRAKSANDIRILTQALEARRVTQGSTQQKTGVAAVAGLLLSALLSLLIEYVRKARALRAEDSRP